MVFVILTAGALPLVAALVGAVFFATTFVGIAVFFAAAFLVANDLSQSGLRSCCGICFCHSDTEADVLRSAYVNG